MEDQFETFWKAYPRRISKGAARKAFAKAIAKTSLETMLAALKDYVAFKPAYQDYKHPSTWLNNECWFDDWSPPPAPVTQPQQQSKRGLFNAAMDVRARRQNPASDNRDDYGHPGRQQLSIAGGLSRPH